jgi:A/G-specific adenine glycosylase
LVKKLTTIKTTEDYIKFRSDLLNWYYNNYRDLPWRKTKNPYFIWISEVMLQQTQVKKVLEYYPKFIKKFPDIYNLTKADLQDVLKSWELLGYYARARNLHKSAKIISEKYNGNFPRDRKKLIQLSGIGSNTSSAILSIAFDLPYPVLDGNVKRIISRLFMIDAPINSSLSNKILLEKITVLLDREKPGDFNQAMMELGAIICKSQMSICRSCPMKNYCMAYQNGKQTEYPVRKKKKKIPHYNIAVGIIQKKNKILITKRKPEGLLGGLWEFPGGKIKDKEKPIDACIREIKEELNLKIDVLKELTQVLHAYTHFTIKMWVYLCNYRGGRISLKSALDYRWIKFQELDHFPFPGANHKFLSVIKDYFNMGY